MFNNAGGKLKGLAQIVFWIITVLSCIGGLTLIIEGTRYSGWMFIVGILVAALGVLVGWLTVIQVYCLGVITENTDKIVKLQGGIPSSNIPADKVFDNININHNSQTTVNKTEEYTNVCPNCGKNNKPGVKFCAGCGNKLA